MSEMFWLAGCCGRSARANRKDVAMLVLSRNVGERIVIGDDVEVEVLSVTGGKVSLGIVAPKNVTVHRKEVWEKVKDGKDQRDGE